jgi:PAS domain S-box-containing protein
MTGFSHDELIGSGLPHLYWPPEEYEQIDKAYQKLGKDEVGNLELVFMKKNGVRFPVIVSPSAITDNFRNIISYSATVKDITSLLSETLKNESA